MPYKDIEKHRQRRREISKEYAKAIQDYKESHPCTDCGVQYPYYVMQFDHISGTKGFNISRKRNSLSFKRFLEEIAKCEIVCANCHAERTYQRILTE